jgi:anaerobic ribonucleoside-triphosphate reductase activating protein
MKKQSGNATLRVSSVMENSSIYGPGSRYVIWVQGCSLGCVGCWNQKLWPTAGGNEVRVDDMVLSISRVDGIEGVTILGGEPLEQAAPMLKLLREVRSLGLTVMLYSGYEESELDTIQTACVESSDIVILGRYIAALRDTSMRWRGSSNQEVRLVSEAYAGLEIEEANEVEITITVDGRISMVGYPNAALRMAIKDL